ncbi:restriction endonuclease subunit S [Marinobacter lipolyticus]|uniref:restriction endonuclease subunit S n=1 Tax=Marinobacter lipolyticus TaxID=209639 RepID=UPI001BCFAE7D|nr:restriction endonuclease subunit S [Marinobacter lipolyticus]MBS8239743.1 restriction endonuclease subunit S [Marinobacter lipolyticus]
MSARELITKHLDLWTGAVTKKSSSGRGSNGKFELTGVKKLRELILELAARGKLIEQNLESESAESFLARLKEERASLEEKKLLKKRRKPVAALSTNNLPALPANWSWCQLGEIAFKLTDGSHNPPKDAGSGIPMLSSQNVNFGVIDFERPSRYLTSEAFEKEDARTGARAGDVLLTIVASLGRAAVVPKDAPYFALQRSVAVIETPINSEFLAYQLIAPHCLSYYDTHGKGTAQKGIYLGKLAAMPIAIPPEEEQNRIVQKVDELMALCDRLEQQTSDQLEAHETLVDTLLGTLTQSENATELAENWARLAAHFDTLFTTEQSIDKLKQTILQLAVMGRLVEQDAEDESATELLKKVAMEEDRLRTSGKFRRKRPTKFGTNQSAQQSLPSGWALAPLSQLGRFSGGKTPSKSKSQFWGGHIPWVTPKDMKTQKVEGSEDKVTQLAVDEGLELFPENAVLFVVRSGILRRMFPTAVSTIPCTVNQDLKVLTPHLPELSPYIQLMMLGFEQFILHNLTKTGTTVESLKFEEFANCQFPIPPFKEQVRIRKRVQELMALSDQLKERLNQASETRCQLAEAVVEKGLSA